MKKEILAISIIPMILGLNYYTHKDSNPDLKSQIEESKSSIYDTKNFENISFRIGKPIITKCIGKDDYTTACVSNDKNTFMIIPIVIRNDSDYAIDINDYDFFISDDGYKDGETYESHEGASAMFMSGSYLPDAFIGPGMQTIDYTVFEVDERIAGFDICIEGTRSKQCHMWH